MTMRETLNFLAQFHEHLERTLDVRGIGSWPTRAMIAEALHQNSAAFPRDKNPRWSYQKQLTIALKNHLVAITPCEMNPKYHSCSHVWLTEKGQGQLALMNKTGCETGEHVERRLKFPKVAA